MIRMIASDIDGTLVGEGENRLDERLVEVILKLKERGIHFVAASGRQIHSIEEIFTPIRDKIFYIGHNGAYVGIYGRNLFLYPMDRALAEPLMADIQAEPDFNIMVETASTAYLEPKDPEFICRMRDGYRFQVTVVDDVKTITDPIIKVSAFVKRDMDRAFAFLHGKYGGGLKVTMSGRKWIDCMAPGVCKGRALASIQESLGVSAAETMAFGDQMNDLEMMERAYYSFAVGNARPEVKAAARFQADTNADGGVLKILELLL